MANTSYEIIESFQIAGRGLVVVIEETINFGVGKPLSLMILRPDNTSFEATGFQERLLRRVPEPIEKTAILPMGVEKSQVPGGSRLKIVQGCILASQ